MSNGFRTACTIPFFLANNSRTMPIINAAKPNAKTHKVEVLAAGFDPGLSVAGSTKERLSSFLSYKYC